jgi:hypothetical protein
MNCIHKIIHIFIVALLLPEHHLAHIACVGVIHICRTLLLLLLLL